MKCEHIKELLLTDYLDDQVTESQKQKIEEHLARCVVCRELAGETREFLKKPFENTQQIKAPGHLWNKIKAAIEQQQKESLIQKAWDALSDTFAKHKPAFALSTVAVSILFLAMLVKIPEWQTARAANDYLIEQFDYIVSSDSQEDAVADGFWVDEYFL